VVKTDRFAEVPIDRIDQMVDEVGRRRARRADERSGPYTPNGT
jgi:hypothetical protein